MRDDAAHEYPDDVSRGDDENINDRDVLELQAIGQVEEVIDNNRGSIAGLKIAEWPSPLSGVPP